MRTLLKSLMGLLRLYSCSTKKEETVDLEHANVHLEMVADLTAPPFVPKPTAKRKAKKLIVDMEIVEKEMESADGVKYILWTFGGDAESSFVASAYEKPFSFKTRNPCLYVYHCA